MSTDVRRRTEWVGTFRLVVSPDLAAFIETTFVATQPQELRDHARAEALDEARGAELVITEEGTIVSRAHGQEFYRILRPAEDWYREEVNFEKAPSSPVTLRLLDKDTILALQPGKPPVHFRRT
jgi:hypothetical protein